MVHKPKNIIFDLGGVLFEQQAPAGYYGERIFKPLIPGIELLRECYKQKRDECRFFICSNWGDRALAVLKRDYADIIKLFEGVVTPTLAQAKKPDPKIFRYLMQTYNLSAHECVFIDDQEPNVKTAEFLGMKGVHVTDFNHVATQLKKLLAL
jgi:FMN phosphatase YigB (HAD superfamily)